MKHANLLLFICICLAGNSWALEADTSQKEFIKSYSEIENETLYIDNRFGNITLSQWNQRTIRVSIQIIASGEDKVAADKSMERIIINDEHTKSAISFVTTISSPTRGLPSGQADASVAIHYLVQVPRGQAINLKNQFGNIRLEDCDGKTDITLRYGTLDAGRLIGHTNISLQQGSVTIKALNGGRITARGFESLNVGIASSTVFLDLSGGDRVNLWLSSAIKALSLNSGHIGNLSVALDQKLDVKLELQSIFSAIDNKTDMALLPVSVISPSISTEATYTDTASKKRRRIPSAPQASAEPEHRAITTKNKKGIPRQTKKDGKKPAKTDPLTPKFYQGILRGGKVPLHVKISYSTLNLTIR